MKTITLNLSHSDDHLETPKSVTLEFTDKDIERIKRYKEFSSTESENDYTKEVSIKFSFYGEFSEDNEDIEFRSEFEHLLIRNSPHLQWITECKYTAIKVYSDHFGLDELEDVLPDYESMTNTELAENLIENNPDFDDREVSDLITWDRSDLLSEIN